MTHSRRFALTGLRSAFCSIAVATVLVLACGEGKSGPTEPETPAAPPSTPPSTPPAAPASASVATVALTGAPTAPVLVGGTLQLTATPQDSAGAPLTGRALTWASSDTTVVRVSTTGLVTSLAAGRATITVTCEQKSAVANLEFRVGGALGPDGGSFSVLGGTVTVTVPAAALTQSTALTVAPYSLPSDPDMVGGAFQIGPDSLTFAKSAKLTLVYPTPLGTNITDNSLQLFVRTGNAWTVVPGSTVDAVNKTVSASITRTGIYAVLTTRVARVAISGALPVGPMYVGRTAQLIATAYDAASNTLTGRAVTWSSSDTTKLRVSSTGLVTAVAPGTASITALTEGVRATVAIVVDLPPIGSITIAPTNVVTYAGLATKITATLTDNSGATITGRTITWTSSNAATVAVDSTGTATAAGTGSATITASAGGKSATVAFTVKPDAPADCTQLTEWTTFQGNASHTGCVPVTLNPATFTELWVTTVPTAGVINPVVEGGGSVFVSTNAYATQTLTALDGRTGTQKWSYDFGSINSVDPPAYDNGMVYVQTGGHQDSYLWGFDAATGVTRFRNTYGNQWSRWFAPVVMDGAVFMAAGYYGGMASYDKTSGIPNWSISLNQYDNWTPAVRNGLAYAYTGSYSPKVSVVNAASGAVVYEIPDPHFSWNGWSMNISPVLGGSSDLLATQGGRLISFDLANRRVKWEKSGTFTGNVTVANGTLYVIGNNQVEAHSESDGSLLWIWVPPEGRPAGTMIATNNILFVSTSANTYAVDLTSHTHVWTYPHAGQLALGKQGTLFVAQSDGKVAAVQVQ